MWDNSQEHACVNGKHACTMVEGDEPLRIRDNQLHVHVYAARYCGAAAESFRPRPSRCCTPVRPLAATRQELAETIQTRCWRPSSAMVLAVGVQNGALGTGVGRRCPVLRASSKQVMHAHLAACVSGVAARPRPADSTRSPRASTSQVSSSSSTTSTTASVSSHRSLLQTWPPLVSAPCTDRPRRLHRPCAHALRRLQQRRGLLEHARSCVARVQA
jgi:hypothetical protein